MNSGQWNNEGVQHADWRRNTERSLTSLLMWLPLILRRIISPEPWMCPITGRTSQNRTSNGPIGGVAGHIRAYAESVFGTFPVKNKTPERLLLESETERFIRHLLEKETTIREICLTIIEMHLSERGWSQRALDERIYLCLLNNWNIIQWMNICMKHVSDEISQEQWQTFDPEVLRKIRENAPVGIQQINMLFTSLLLSYQKQYGHFPEPEKLKKFHWAIVNIMTQMARGPVFFSLIMRDAIGKSLKNPESIFYFRDDGSVTISTRKWLFIIKELELEIDVLELYEKTRTWFENRHCAGLTLIPQLTVMQTRILTDMYKSVYEHSRNTLK